LLQAQGAISVPSAEAASILVAQAGAIPTTQSKEDSKAAVQTAIQMLEQIRPEAALQSRCRGHAPVQRSDRSPLQPQGKTSQQKVTAKHVHVHQGGQAIVGNFTKIGGQGREMQMNKDPMENAAPRLGRAPLAAIPPCRTAAVDYTVV
jgi:hypothetical protein